MRWPLGCRKHDEVQNFGDGVLDWTARAESVNMDHFVPTWETQLLCPRVVLKLLRLDWGNRNRKLERLYKSLVILVIFSNSLMKKGKKNIWLFQSIYHLYFPFSFFISGALNKFVLGISKKERSFLDFTSRAYSTEQKEWYIYNWMENKQ